MTTQPDALIEPGQPWSAQMQDLSAEKVSPLRRFYLDHQRPILGTTGIVLFLAVWEAFGRSGLVKPVLISAPSIVLAEGFKLLQTPAFYNDLRVSLTEFLVGFGLALLLAVPLGLIIGWYKPANALTEPLLAGINSMPRIALMPVIVIWFGIGIWSKIAIVFLGAFFPIILNTATGVRIVDHRLLRAARSFGASDLHIFKTIVLPSCVPFILTGMRIGVGRALVGVVVGELFAANEGIGFMLMSAGTTLQTGKAFFGVLIIAAMGIFSDYLFRYIESRFDVWRPKVGADR